MMMQRYIFLLAGILLLTACGKGRTEKQLLDKRWKVYDVTPPQTGVYDVDAANQADELKNGFYKNAWFEFEQNGIFKANFAGKTDSGKFKVSRDGEIISLYPLHSSKMYEQIQIQQLSASTLRFNTLIAKFDMTLDLKTE